MIIRKQFSFEGAHIVRNCSSERCSKSIHGHSYIVELFLEADYLDNGYMVYDFGLLKDYVKSFIDAFDHTYVIWNKEEESFKSSIKELSARWIEVPLSPSAESFSLMFFTAIQAILNHTEKNNGESQSLKIHSVRVHETASGYAECFEQDVAQLVGQTPGKERLISQIQFSEAVTKELSDKDMLNSLVSLNCLYHVVTPYHHIKE